MPCFQENLLSFSYNRTVPQTDTGGQVENTQALERTRGEGTRQIDTVTSGEGVPLLVKSLRMELMKVAKVRWLRLFIKNTALCKDVSRRIGCDACPVPEG